MRARTSSVSSTSCLVGVLIVLRLDAMKSARRAGSSMFIASVCRSSDSSGDSDTTFWKLLLMFLRSASISRRSSSRSTSSTAETFARRYGFSATISSSVTRDRPWTMSRRLPSGSLNILWMCVAVPTGYRSAWIGSSSAGSRCAKTPITFPAAIASSIRRTELSRATASGMNEFGKSTVSLSGSTGNSDGSGNDRVSLTAETTSAGGFWLIGSIAHGDPSGGYGGNEKGPGAVSHIRRQET